MNPLKTFLSLLLLSGFSITILNSQSTIPASGGNTTGTGGSVSYSIGQIVFTTNTGANGTVSQGVQQPYEISVATAIKNTGEITLECLVFPNPTRGKIMLVIRTKEFVNLRFQLYDLNGIRIQDTKIESEETEIIMDSLLPSTYFLKILSGNNEINIFKIIKN